MPMKWALYDALHGALGRRVRCADDLFRTPDARGERV